MKRSAPLRRTAFKRSASVPAASAQKQPRELKPATRTATYSGSVQPAPKTAPKREPSSRKAEQAHKSKLAELGCMVCRRLYPHLAPGPVELHHLREGGWGKGGYLTLMPLCVEHHRGDTGVHGLGTRGFVKFYGFTQADLLRDALALIGQQEKEKQ